MFISAPDGTPSITPPIALPCDSPNVVKRKIVPIEFPAIGRNYHIKDISVRIKPLSMMKVYLIFAHLDSMTNSGQVLSINIANHYSEQ
jgi:hypothetical protein